MQEPKSDLLIKNLIALNLSVSTLIDLLSRDRIPDQLSKQLKDSLREMTNLLREKVDHNS